MKRIFLSIFLLCILNNYALTLQTSINGAEEEYNNYPISIGPVIGIKGGVNAASVPDGIENGIAVNEFPDFGINFYMPFTSKAKFGAVVDILYSNYYYRLNFYNNPNLAWKDKFKYLTIGTSVHASGFIVGLNFGVPLGGVASNRRQYTSQTVYYDIKPEQMSFLVELKLGGMLPLFEDETGRLNLIIMGGYFLTAIYNDNGVKSTWGEEFYPHPVTLGMGLNYMFNLTNPWK